VLRPTRAQQYVKRYSFTLALNPAPVFLSICGKMYLKMRDSRPQSAQRWAAACCVWECVHAASVGQGTAAKGAPSVSLPPLCPTSPSQQPLFGWVHHLHAGHVVHYMLIHRASRACACFGFAPRRSRRSKQAHTYVSGTPACAPYPRTAQTPRLNWCAPCLLLGRCIPPFLCRLAPAPAPAGARASPLQQQATLQYRAQLRMLLMHV